MKSLKLILVTVLLVSACLCEDPNPAVPALGSYNVDIKQTSVSGISAGAFMANQFHVAFSSDVIGAGIVAGGPFACALGSMTTALTSCMNSPVAINLNTLYRKAQGLGSKIDDLSNLKGQKVYIYDGTEDTVVKPGVGKKGADWYENYGADLKTVYDVPSEHAWITNNYGNPCTKLKTPFISNCNYNQAEDVLTWIYGSLKPGVTQNSSNLLRFDQSKYTSSGDSLGDVGYVYVPTACQQGNPCKVHISFHGCKMTLADIGTAFVANSGLNEIAEANNFIILYPQAKKSLLAPSNPNGCFDWWGYTCNATPLQTSLTYATKDGKQMSEIYDMLTTLAKGYKPQLEQQSILQE